MFAGSGSRGRRDIVPEWYMQRCLQLARSGAGYVAPNPMVGAVLVYKERIIGEGYHQRYGEAHAEVNCIADVAPADIALIPQSTLYVSLEPCSHFGKTPPCSDLIIRHKIPKVVIGRRDPFKEVNGKGIEKLQQAGVEVVVGVLEKECQQLNSRFFTWNTLHRPYVILKWAQSGNGKIAASGDERLFISNEYSNRLVHRWRSEEPAILVGTNTALLDNPALTTRLWQGPSPVRMVIDMDLRLPSSLQLFDGQARTIVFNGSRHEEEKGILYYRLSREISIVPQIIQALYELKIQSVLVEGGTQLLQSFIDANAWDEARKITNRSMIIRDGLPAPELKEGIKVKEMKLLEDVVEVYHSKLLS